VIRSSSALNVELCRTTGEFFRTWGLPGSRFVPVKPSGQPVKPSGQPPGSRFVPVPEDG
jgi:hypothetical protein